MAGLIGALWTCLAEDLMYCGGFCRFFHLPLGTPVSGALILPGLILLDHLLGCIAGLACYPEEEKTADLNRRFREAMRRQIAEMGLTGVEAAEDGREQYPGPYGHCLDKPWAYSGDLPDPVGEGPEAGAAEELKARDPMRRVGLMNTCKAQAEEIIFAELIYC